MKDHTFGKIVFIIFLLLLTAFMWWVAEDSNRNADAVLDRTAYIDGIDVKGGRR